MIDIDYYHPHYSDKIQNNSNQVDPYNINGGKKYYEGKCFKRKVLFDHLEFYSQLKIYEQKNNFLDSRFQKEIKCYYGTLDVKTFVALTVMD